MAQIAQRRRENVEGDFYVDRSCIDCDTCRWMAPETYTAAGGKAAVHHQPQNDDETLRALQALVACPTASIGTVEKHDMAEVVDSFPLPVHGNVYHCGYHDESSFGAASYLIVRPDGNVLVDAPRFTRPLVRRLEALGGVDTMFLTHRDDVGDHARFHDWFECERIIHADDATGALADVEHLLTGIDPIHHDEEITILPVPGHTRGSCVLIWRETYLFSGDHVAWSDRLGQVYAFRRACWYDWTTQIESMRRLARFDFEWILPGHGRRCHFDRERMHEEMVRAVEWMESA